MLTDRGGDDARPPTTPSTTAPDDTEFPPTPEELLELMPAGPLDGKESWRLPVLVTPQSGVADGQLVTALGRGFLPGEQVGVVMCTSEASVEGVAACDLGTPESAYAHVTYADASPDGAVIADVVLRRFITTPLTGPVDCTSAAERCLVAIGAVSDYDRSGGSFVGFAGAPPFPEPTLVVEPPGPYAPGQLVAVRAAGLVPPRDAQVLQCRDLRCTMLAGGIVAPDGTFVADVAAHPVFVDQDGGEVVCEDACVLAVTGIGVDESTAAPTPPPVPITFVPIEDPVLAAPPRTAPPATESVPTSVQPETTVVDSTLPGTAPTTSTTTG